MKKVLSGIFIVCAVVAFTSCKKCATCTSVSQVTNLTDTSSFCDKGKRFADLWNQHEKSGWNCIDDKD